jgi:hypothetical protein
MSGYFFRRIFNFMGLLPSEIKSRAIQFVEEHHDDKYEKGESQLFWRDFFNIFGLSAKKIGIFEERAKTLKGNVGFIDYFWPGTLLIEQKSLGENLDEAFKQALDYCITGGVKEEELPKYICVSDFANIRLINLEDQSKKVEFKTKDLVNHLHHFNFILGYEQREYKDEDPVNIKAAEIMGKLHDELYSSGYKDHQLRLLLVRLMFCFFADDTGIFNKDEFHFYLKEKTRDDGSDLGMVLSNFFELLNTSEENRQSTLEESLKSFPYVNGQLFEEHIPMAHFGKTHRDVIIKCCEFDWSKVSPAIFGSLFQSVMDKEARRELGAHYTSEKNILKTIHSLFLDELYEEFDLAKSKRNLKNLEALLAKVRKIKILDPACGCGNFLILSYRELRILEIELLKEIAKLKKISKEQELSIEWMNGLDVDILYGIEIEEFPAQIAKTAIWIMDHLMNVRMGQEFGNYLVRLPLKKSPKIVNGNALRINWDDVINPADCTYILGNPPFVGKKEQNHMQKDDMNFVFKNLKGVGVLDYVTSWYVKSAEFITNSKIKVAFVSTNSICQGEQVGILWNLLFSNFKIKIHFAHRTFNWKNEAKGNAAVHCVIIGFASFDIIKKRIFEYKDIKGDPFEINVKNINPYLFEGKDLIITNRKSPICNVSEMNYGSMPIDDGNLIISDNEKESLLSSNPELNIAIRQYTGGDEFINKKKRWCLWLMDLEPSIIKNSKLIINRIDANKTFRLNSGRDATKKLAMTPMLFGENRQPNSDYILIPKVSSENRDYIPIGILPPSIIVNGSALVIKDANLLLFGILNSIMHMSWMKLTCGRMKSDFQYSASIVYNNFPWPEDPSEKQKKEVEDCGQIILDTRAEFPDSSLADLYNPLTMPKKLREAHNKLDRAVDKCYRSKPFASEEERVEFLFELYEKYTNTLTSQIKESPKKKKAK